MRILHTSDWHIGRTFHTHSTLDHVRVVLGGIADAVRERQIDVVAVAGDVFDSGMPSAAAIEVLGEAFRNIREAGAQIVMTSGNHDSITRLGIHAEWIGPQGIHILTQHRRLDVPTTIDDGFGPVHFYGIPYLEPALIRHEYPGVELRTHEQALGFAMQRIRDDAAQRGGRSVVLSHCFTADVAASDVERDISAGGLDLVPTAVFDGPDYVALGHIHGRAQLSDRVRYSGAPLHYSFSEAGKLRGGWLVELDAGGLVQPVEWLDLPVPRRLRQLTGTLDELLTDERHDDAADDWVKAVVTDQVRPMDGMRRLQARFPHCVAFEWAPTVTVAATTETYRARVHEKSDADVVAGFLEHVRNGVGPTEFERGLVAELLVAGTAVTRS